MGYSYSEPSERKSPTEHSLGSNSRENKTQEIAQTFLVYSPTLKASSDTAKHAGMGIRVYDQIGYRSRQLKGDKESRSGGYKYVPRYWILGY